MELLDKSEVLKHIYDCMDKLMLDNYDWEEIDYLPPQQEMIDYGKEVAKEFINALTGDQVYKPYVCHSGEGGPEMDWRFEKRSLHVHIEHAQIVITKVWGENGATIVKSDIITSEDYLDVWEWALQDGK